MTPPIAPPDCPDEWLLAAFLDDQLDERQRDDVAAQVAGCSDCTAELERLSSRWSFGPLARDTNQRPGEQTLAITARLAHALPAPAAPVSGQAAIPRAAPAIPGLVDLEPIGRGGMGVVYRGAGHGPRPDGGSQGALVVRPAV